jgi:hypothetical protein
MLQVVLVAPKFDAGTNQQPECSHRLSLVWHAHTAGVEDPFAIEAAVVLRVHVPNRAPRRLLTTFRPTSTITPLRLT